ncbi:hypothetical protein P5673_026506, partial [Acropora cervicornis]
MKTASPSQMGNPRTLAPHEIAPPSDRGHFVLLILPSKTVILPYASPPLKPISQVTLQVSKGNFACSLTFQVINTDQPALLSTEASKALKVLTPQ